MRPLDSPVRLHLVVTTGEEPSRSRGLENEVVDLFDQLRDPVFRYVLALGLAPDDGEDVLQEVFLALFRHLLLGRDRRNLRGWIFRVAHNLSLKRRVASQRAARREDPGVDVADTVPDQAPSVEEQMVFHENTARLGAVLRALPEQDQHCLRLRAEGLRYREIAAVLGISLGSVSLSLTRSLARMQRAGGR